MFDPRRLRRGWSHVRPHWRENICNRKCTILRLEKGSRTQCQNVRLCSFHLDWFSARGVNDWCWNGLRALLLRFIDAFGFPKESDEEHAAMKANRKGVGKEANRKPKAPVLSWVRGKQQKNQSNCCNKHGGNNRGY